MRVEAFERHQMRSNATTVSSHHKLMFWMQKCDFLLMNSIWVEAHQQEFYLVPGARHASEALGAPSTIHYSG